MEEIDVFKINDDDNNYYDDNFDDDPSGCKFVFNRILGIAPNLLPSIINLFYSVIA